MKQLIFFFVMFVTFSAFAEITVINGVKYECKNGMCMIVDDDDEAATINDLPAPAYTVGETRMAQGYMEAHDFIAFIKNEAPKDYFEGMGIWLIVIMALIGGLMMNLTPCVLPMIPINLMIIGKSAIKGFWYGFGIMIAYGIMGVLAAVGGMAFGAIQGSPWFNAVVAIIFVGLALALCDVFFIDLSKNRSKFKGGAFLMGALSAVLAGACVAPILIAVLLLTAKLFAAGNYFALLLPFVLGLGMALPWPFIGAGLQILPKPGNWMKKVNRGFAVIVILFAGWYGYLAYCGFTAEAIQGEGCTPANFAEKLGAAKRPVLVDCWASWCKNCSAMEKTVMSQSEVVKALETFTVIKLQAEDIKELTKLPGFEAVKGLPAFVIFE